jgi:cytochrome c
MPDLTPSPARRPFFLTLAIGLLACAALPPDARADLALATSKNCMGCHALNKKLIGPAYSEIAAKYKGRKDAESLLTDKVLKGSSGVWGTVAMPAATNVSEAEAKKLVAWVLSQ